jgi:hypothetical protein
MAEDKTKQNRVDLNKGIALDEFADGGMLLGQR